MVAANDKTLKFYDFIDKVQKEKDEKLVKSNEETNQIMKDLFNEIVDKEFCADMKLNRTDLQSYFTKLWNAFKFKTIDPVVSCQFEAATSVSEECFEDVWYEIDINQTGYITWH